MNKAQHLFMNYWVPMSGLWGEGLNDSSMPWYVQYDWVEVFTYNWNHTKDGTPEFTWDFRDDFNEPDYTPINTDIWFTSNGWGYDRCTFIRNHVFIKDNALTLKLSKDQNYGMDED